ncbi:hypothetical protein CANARDRAFT_235593 [[Candida] arabinofermentans NRRL YB-2248]|uniref:Phosphatidic acid phosphatase type 2/haloperoxidase domain-containing protein n=1 Tax=[Candida] arabinofermentans NRRL YB-2248 TaxID=983967 RepID=A0A1E4SY95_9ASCO|nr:hypothetical protein CANARDRAFT_235593 [[Candida] arabinofermentans NRRL YB-2248]
MGSTLANLCLDRHNFGLDSIPNHKLLVKWRITDVIYILLIYFLDWFFFENIEPYQRQFTINDLTISHPFATIERVSGSTLIKMVTIMPIIIIFIFNLLLTPKKQKIYVFYISIIGVFVSLGTCIFITDIMKNWIGRCRPDFLARCIPKETALPNTLYYAKDICTQTNMKRLLDGYRTTPSGHSSLSWAAFGYTSFWLMGQLMVSRIHGGAWRSVVSILPSLYASYVALSRTQDYRHHFVDVCLGSILGTLIAWWSYRRLFPSIDSENCYVPYMLIEEKKEGYTVKDFYGEGENYVLAGTSDEEQTFNSDYR